MAVVMDISLTLHSEVVTIPSKKILTYSFNMPGLSPIHLFMKEVLSCLDFGISWVCL